MKEITIHPNDRQDFVFSSTINRLFRPAVVDSLDQRRFIKYLTGDESTMYQQQMRDLMQYCKMETTKALPVGKHRGAVYPFANYCKKNKKTKPP